MRKRRLLALYALLLTLCGAAAARPLAASGEAEIPAVRYAALTFDDGPHPGTTDRLLDGLAQRGIQATFFVIGSQAQAEPELVRRMALAGHQVGNHTWSHVYLDRAADALEEIGRTDDLLRQLLGEGTYWLRPPYGQMSEGLEAQVSVPMVKWSVDPRDWESRDKDKVVAAILEAVEDNSIILLHDIYPTSVDAALEAADILTARGYRFVTVEELLAVNGITPQPGVLYRTGTGP